ncbi:MULTISPECIES: hypothetical protein [unclassified Rhizobium]|nr:MULTISPECIES: hypothetical protein [unclassified Rhizobium]
MPTPSSPISNARMSTADIEYRQFMIRELLVWLVGVPVPIAAVIGFFVL